MFYRQLNIPSYYVGDGPYLYYEAFPVNQYVAQIIMHI